MQKTTSRVLTAAIAVTATVAVAAPAFADQGPAEGDARVACTSSQNPASVKLADRLGRDVSRAIGTKDYLSVALDAQPWGVRCTYRPDSRNDTASLVKPTILAALLHAEHGRLTDRQKALASKMIIDSDNDSAAALWKDLSDMADPATPNTTVFRSFLATAGMTGTVPDGDSTSWGLTRTTAADQLKLLDILTGRDNTVLNSQERDYELGLMRQVRPDQRWGATADVPAAAQTAVKNGWLQRSQNGPTNDFDRLDWKVNSMSAVSGGQGEDRYASNLVVLTQDNRVPKGEAPFYGFRPAVAKIQQVAEAVNKDLYPNLPQSARYLPPPVERSVATN
ncbi:hypothetical protein [Streptomyces sp. NPDC089919]|uniref:hypothetical protein n=1 Tax=Streptomyces sp. NPDC089919 TaxID=3155188 RepID=UPI00342D4C4F